MKNVNKYYSVVIFVMIAFCGYSQNENLYKMAIKDLPQNNITTLTDKSRINNNDKHPSYSFIDESHKEIVLKIDTIYCAARPASPDAKRADNKVVLFADPKSKKNETTK